jgi:hypothetical protein
MDPAWSSPMTAEWNQCPRRCGAGKRQQYHLTGER